MKFNEKQSKQIYDFVMMYNTEEGFKASIEDLYNKEPGQMPILHIYALEEILRYGTKGLFNNFFETKGIATEEQAVDLYDGFISLLNADENFKQHKLEQLESSPETLSSMELFAFSLIHKPETKKEQIHEEASPELEYDPLNPILFGSDKQIRETLEDLFFGEFIHKILNLPTMQIIKDRQEENGRIANSDKPIIIEQIRSVVFEQDGMSQFKQAIDSRYVKVKMALLLGNGEEVFKPYSQFNTNISANEILGREKDTTAEDMYAEFSEIIARKKAQNGSFTQADAMDMINRVGEEKKGPQKK